MLPPLTLPNGRSTSALSFGCASLLRLPDPADRQRLLAVVSHQVPSAEQLNEPLLR
jgi:hypothetical protein